ncbi:MAG: EamA family transporter, partial [Aggregatilineales bacterium]
TLAVINTVIAYIIFYEVVRQLGAAKATMVTYVVPVVGLVLGVMILSEPLDVYIIVGTALIFAGIGIVNLRIFNRKATMISVGAGG